MLHVPSRVGEAATNARRVNPVLTFREPVRLRYRMSNWILTLVLCASTLSAADKKLLNLVRPIKSF
ncbi:hypothetical protein SBA3_2090008 [Candidatus Sulfopaludibacter sp. SbA3]|nr:hypothetical protein SBA3_2090008 [Candidatus Sulfopaludibacter sp. SbA3]